MKNNQPTLEHAFYALAVILAVSLRFLNLGMLPLSDFEANWSIQALQIVQGLRPVIGSNPAYVHLTAMLFFVFGATNFLARFWPALAGTALVLSPWFLRGRIGRIPALVVAFGVAIDPGLVAMSHLAGGPLLAISALVFTGLMWMNGHRTLAGIFAGLALLSGTSIWFGLLGLVVVGLFARSLTRKARGQTDEQAAENEEPAAPAEPAEPPTPATSYSMKWVDLKVSIVSGGLTLLFLGSLFILSPKGLSAIVFSFIDFLRGWVTLSDIPMWRLLLALPAYEILPFGFGIAGAVRGIVRKDRTSILLGAWALIAILLALIYPGKQTSDLTWALVPLWVLAAMELGHHLDFERRDLWEFVGLIAVIFVLLIFGWLDLASVTRMDLTMSIAHMRLSLLLAVGLLVGLSILLAGAGWSTRVARLGGVWAVVTCLTLFTIAMSTGAAGLRQPLTFDLWQPEPRTGRVDVMLSVANQISDLNMGEINALPLTVQGVNSSALQWLFRSWQVQFVDALEPDATPEVVITPISQVSLAAKYRGEALPLREVADWDHATTSDWLNWLVYRQIPVLRENIILWVRSDLMLDSQGVPTVSPSP
jgi:hypothetical protein